MTYETTFYNIISCLRNFNDVKSPNLFRSVEHIPHGNGNNNGTIYASQLVVSYVIQHEKSLQTYFARLPHV